MDGLTEDEKRYEKYIDVAMELLTGDGSVSPSARALVERLGGSMTTANKAMRVFWQYIGRRLSYDQQYPDGMPLEVIKMMEKLMAAARKAADRELDEEKARLERYEEEMAARVATLESSIDSLSNELSGSQAEAVSLREQLGASAQQLEQSKAVIDGLSDKNTELTGDVAGLKKQLSQTEEMVRERDRSLESLTSELRVLQSGFNDKSTMLVEVQNLNKVLQERLEHAQSKEQKLQEAVRVSDERATAQRSRIEELQEEISSNRTTLAVNEVDAAESKRRLSSMQERFDALHDEKATLQERVKLLESKVNEIAPLCARNQEIEKRVADLIEERSRLLTLVKNSLPPPSL